MDMHLSPVSLYPGSFDPEWWTESDDGIHVSRSLRGCVTFSAHRQTYGSRGWLSLTVAHGQASQKIIISVNGYELALSRIEPRIAISCRQFDVLLPPFLLAAPVLRCTLISEVGTLRIRDMVLEVEPPEHPEAEVTDQEVMSRFASIGCDCEFGFAQRAVGIEPLGLLRFGGARSIFHLLHHLRSGFSDLLAPGSFRAGINGHGEAAEWFLTSADGTYALHTWQHPDSIAHDAVIEQTETRVRYLVRSLIEDIEDGEKIFVYKSFDYVDHHEILALYRALSRYGRPKLLCVTRPAPGRPTGSLIQLSGGIVHGFLGSMLDNGQLGNGSDWLALCHAAYRIFLNNAHGSVFSRTVKEPAFMHQVPNFTRS